MASLFLETFQVDFCTILHLEATGKWMVRLLLGRRSMAVSCGPTDEEVGFQSTQSYACPASRSQANTILLSCKTKSSWEHADPVIVREKQEPPVITCPIGPSWPISDPQNMSPLKWQAPNSSFPRNSFNNLRNKGLGGGRSSPSVFGLPESSPVPLPSSTGHKLALLTDPRHQTPNQICRAMSSKEGMYNRIFTRRLGWMWLIVR